MVKLGSINQDTEEGRHCPKCGADWRATEIPREYVEKGHYGHDAPCQKLREWDEGFDENTPCTCPPKFYSRLIGIDRPDYDGVGEWMCPDCDTRWSRWTHEELPGMTQARRHSPTV